MRTLPFKDKDRNREYQREWIAKKKAKLIEKGIIPKPMPKEYSFMRDGKMVRVRVIDGVYREV